MVAGVGRGEGEKSGGEEHGFVIGVGDEEDDGFIGEVGVGGACQVGGEEPKGGDEDGNGEDGVVVHSRHYRASSELKQCGCSRHSGKVQLCCERLDRDKDRDKHQTAVALVPAFDSCHQRAPNHHHYHLYLCTIREHRRSTPLAPS